MRMRIGGLLANLILLGACGGGRGAEPAHPVPVSTVPVDSTDPSLHAETDDGPPPESASYGAPWRPGEPIPSAWLNPALATGPAPDRFTARFVTTRGDFVVLFQRDWAPRGVDRFYHLAQIGYYTDIALFRVVRDFMVQFGIHGEPEVNKVWRKAHIEDDPVVESNVRGALTFAMAGPNTRTVQVFVNTVDNSRLDTMGFAPLGKVVEGMDVVDSIYAEYGEGAPRGEGPAQGLFQSQGNAYIRKDFPKMDFIEQVVVGP